ncbi:MAG TPA: M28 family peptidase [Gaiellaceae bacterium]|nr:M28 family peptidase [Gaiellaceae bacterium]
MGLPLLVAAFSVERPSPLPAPTTPTTQFDGASALSLAQELSKLYPDRAPGTAGSLGAARWLIEKMRLYSYTPQTDTFEATVPGRGRKQFRNISFTIGPANADTIVVMAHRDDSGLSAGANDNASGTAAMIELARVYGRPPGAPALAGGPRHQLVFLSTDGGAFGALGAKRFVERFPDPSRIAAVVNLDSIAGRGKPRVEIAGDAPRSPASVLVETAAARIAEQTGARPGRTSALGQLTDLGFPFSLYEQAPLVGRGVPAITLTTSGDRPPGSFGDTVNRLDRKQLADVGRAAQNLVGAVDEFGLVRSGGSYVYLGQRLVHGWAIELALVAMLVPFAVAAVDLFARCRRRRIPVLPALRAYRSRLGVWLWAGLMFVFLDAAGAWPGGAASPLNPETRAATHWPLLGIALLTLLTLPAWLVSRARLAPRRPATAEEELAGHTAAMLALGVVALLVVATNPFALVFLLPCLHVWLWLPHMRERRPGARIGLLLAGFLGPFILVGSFMFRFGLGLDAPWYLAELTAIGYITTVAFFLVLCWFAGAAQLSAIAAGRYAPYPSADERPPLGPIRSTVRTVVLGVRARRRAGAADEAAEA